MMTVKPIPDGFHTVTPYLIVESVPDLIEFLKAAFEAEEIHRTDLADGRVGHPWGGLHSTADDLAILLQTFLNGGEYGQFRLFSPETTAAMTRDHNGAIGAPWGLGWALRDSRAWNYFGNLASAGTFGHVGATGTVAWADPARQLIVVLLTTRSHRREVLLNSISNMAQAAVVDV